MKKSKKSKGRGAAPQVDPYLEGLMAKLIDRLEAIEKRTEMILSRVSAKTEAVSHPRPAQVPAPPAPKRERQLYEAICADCSKVCEVPFRPSESRPVYCKPCFAKRKGRSLEMNMPVFTPVSLPPKPAGKLGEPQRSVSAAAVADKPKPKPKAKPVRKTSKSKKKK